MLEYKGMLMGKFQIYDPDDGTTELVEQSDINELFELNIPIGGLYMKKSGMICDEEDNKLFKFQKTKKNSNLSKAKKAKNDEFYTQLVDIEKELSHYPPETFKDKVIYCPMDVATTQGAILRSEFVHYFQMHAHEFQFKELIATCLHDKVEGDADTYSRTNNYRLKRRLVSYVTEERQILGISPIGEFKGEDGRLYYQYNNKVEPIPQVVVNEAILDKDGIPIMDRTNLPTSLQYYTYEWTFLDDCPADDGFDQDNVDECNANGVYGSGDFRSQYCRKLLERCDIVITNPPFSMFREFVDWIFKADKKFLIIGNQNAITYKEIFPLLRDNKMWIGSQTGITSLFFEVPIDYDVPDDAKKYCISHLGEEHCEQHNMTYLRTACWFTNLDLSKRHEELLLFKQYTPEEYPKFDNYDAINVDKLDDIPCDYDGVMGVPITFMYKHNPDQFEIVAFRKGDDGKDLTFTREREREFNRTFEFLFDGGVGSDYRCEADDLQRRKESLCKDSNTTEEMMSFAEYICFNIESIKITKIVGKDVEPIDMFFPLSTAIPGVMNHPNETLVLGNHVYKRILVRIKTK